MASRTGRFERSDRLRLSKDYRRVSRRGRRFASREFVLLVAPAWKSGSFANGECEPQRLGITVSRRVGCAVVRNRVKRHTREWFRRERGRLARGVDLVLIARSAAGGAEGCDLVRALDALIGREEVRRAVEKAAGRAPTELRGTD